MTTLEGRNPYSDLRVHVPFSQQVEVFSPTHEISEAARILDIDRLRHVRQLGIKFVDPQSPFTNPHSTRLDHELLATFFASEIGRNIGFSEAEIKRLSAETLLHDRGTPALGDGTKYLDPPRLNEEEFWDEDLPHEAWEYLFSLGSKREEIDQAIHNEGLHGSILDIADRMSYVLGDLHQLNRPPLHPDLGGIYKDVALDESGQLYFRDQSRLRNFLWERAELFSRFYIDPKSQAIDLLLPSLIAPLYDPHGTNEEKISPRKLRQLTDKELIDKLAAHYRLGPSDLFDEKFWEVDYQHYPTLEEALNALDQIQENPDLKALGIKVRKGFNPSTDFRVWDKLLGKAVPASDLFSYGMSPYIDSLVDQTTGFLVVHSNANAQGAPEFITNPRIF